MFSILFIIYLFVYFFIVLIIYCNASSLVKNNYVFEVEYYIPGNGCSNSNIVFIYKNGDVKALKNLFGKGFNKKINGKLSNFDEALINTIKMARDDSNSENAIMERKKKIKELNYYPYKDFDGYEIRFNGEDDGALLSHEYIPKYKLEEVFKEIEKYTNGNIFNQ